MKNNECFNCLNRGKGIPAENNGWYHSCKFNIKNEGLQDVESCEKFIPNKGFQIGGYYSHINFVPETNAIDGCLEMIIHSDGEFPKDNPEEFIRFHICDFKQIEACIEYWGKYLREKKIISE